MVTLRIAVDDGTDLSEKELEAHDRFVSCVSEAGMKSYRHNTHPWLAYAYSEYRFRIIRRPLPEALKLVESGKWHVAVGFGDSRRWSEQAALYRGSVFMYGPSHRRWKFWLVGLFHTLDPCKPQTEALYDALEEFLYLLRFRHGTGSSARNTSDNERGGRH